MGDLTNPASYPIDMTSEEKEALKSYVESGLVPLNMNKYRDSHIFKCYQLYMSGQDYDEIANRTKIPKEHILYLSNRYGWLEFKDKSRAILQKNLINKLTIAKLKGANAIVNTLNAMANHQNELSLKDIENNTSENMQNADIKKLTLFLKYFESADRILNPNSERSPNGSQQPLVNVNINQGKIDGMDGNSINVSSQNIDTKTANDILKAMSRAKKEEQLEEENNDDDLE